MARIFKVTREITIPSHDEGVFICNITRIAENIIIFVLQFVSFGFVAYYWSTDTTIQRFCDVLKVA